MNNLFAQYDLASILYRICKYAFCSGLFWCYADNRGVIFQVVGMNFVLVVLFTSVQPTLLQLQPQVQQELFPVHFAGMALYHS